ncbi:hypothetical protein [Natrinema versiforme]|uniref:Twin-arginine translocation signal domain-containing protein n=1 Tax=Natrinema versiforme TaxID=88724 RepID=A0A4P8WKA4_9EURY|nr:hypothetical protein [Natrinema versiforme]QCS43957.1 hypothetical protein FEJ81_17010 [Natrinema versiforme]
MVDNHNHLDIDRRTVLKSIGVGAFVTGTAGSVTATTDDPGNPRASPSRAPSKLAVLTREP